MKTPTYGKRGGVKTFDRGTRKIAHANGKAVVLSHGQKAGGGIALESDSERLVAHLLNIDPDVMSYGAQPFAVELTTGTLARSSDEKDALRTRVNRYGSKAVFYTPDFSLIWASGVRAAIEVKVDEFTGDSSYQRKLNLASQILQSHGYEFMQLVMPRDWRHPLRTNLPLLNQALIRHDIWPTTEVAERIHALHHAGARTMEDYLRGAGLDTRLSPLLLVSGLLEADVVTQALCFATPVSPAYGDLSHLQLMRRLAA